MVKDRTASASELWPAVFSIFSFSSIDFPLFVASNETDEEEEDEEKEVDQKKNNNNNNPNRK